MCRMRVCAFVLMMAVSAACTGRKLDEVSRFRPYLLRSDPVFAVDPNRKEPGNGTVRVAFLGTSTLLIDDGDTQLMIDGFLTRPSLWDIVLHRGTVKTDPDTVDDALRGAGVDHRLKGVFVSHSHYDHALDVAYIAKRNPDAVLYWSPSTQMIGFGGGLDREHAQVFRAGQVIEVGDFSVTVLASNHSRPTVVNNDENVPITEPLYQPAGFWEYAEGGSYDFLIRHRAHTILVKAGTNFVPDALDGIHADVLLLGTGRLGKEKRGFQEAFFDQTIARVQPQLVIPIHWDNLFTRLSENLTLPGKLADDSVAAFDFLIARIGEANRRQPADQAGITFRILQGYESAILFRQGT